MSDSRKKDERNRANGDLVSDLRRALEQEGWIVPESEEGVILAEERLDRSSLELPAELADPELVLYGKQASRYRAILLGGTSSPETEDNLARAAREGGEISPEVEARMRRDRERAEQEKGKPK